MIGIPITKWIGNYGATPSIEEILSTLLLSNLRSKFRDAESFNEFLRTCLVVVEELNNGE